MRLDQILVKKNLCESRQEAQEMIKLGCVCVNGQIITKQTREFELDSTFEVLSRRKYVGRGGEKLEGVLLSTYGTHEGVKSNVAGKTALDIGASTGGFTDCLLKYGVKTVTAIDVGSSQLHQSLRSHPQVISLENTDIRTFISKVSFDIIVADLSFISLENILERIISFGKNGSHFFILIKPQFEVGKGNTKKGIVKDINLIETILDKYVRLSDELELQEVKIVSCGVRGGDGNQEYFLYGILK